MTRLASLIYGILLLLFLSGCGSREFSIPDDVTEALSEAGDNRGQLESVIQRYRESGNVMKEEAVYFLIRNMGRHGFFGYRLMDSTGSEVDFNVLDYTDEKDLQRGWDSLESIRGILEFRRDTLLPDLEVMTADLLAEHIEYAFMAWDQFPWCRHLSFDGFCEYILPYRGSNEPLHSWRPRFYRELGWIADSLEGLPEPAAAANLVNRYLRSWFRFDPRFYHHPADLGLDDMLGFKMGRCEDMTNLALYAMRSLAIPVASDYTPYWANTSNNHAWNVVIGINDSAIAFMGCEADPGIYRLPHIPAKVYRKTFAQQNQTLGSLKKNWEDVPGNLAGSHYLDVTWQYTSVSNVKTGLEPDLPDSTRFAYLCVFNGGSWKPVCYSRIRGNTAYFNDVGRGIAYLPAYYYEGEIIPASVPFILDTAGVNTPLIPKVEIRTDAVLTKLVITSDQSGRTSEISVLPDDHTLYTVMFWDGGWIQADTSRPAGGKLQFHNLPVNALFHISSGERDQHYRLFTYEANRKITWW
ncbi:MAG: transglutaminase domain-containing protein [Bacteroidales bacterium]|nr:transglutaminase domain-containing protein [Bacteroidales bacterium]